MQDESITLLLRRYADGEMTPAESAAFEARLVATPELAAPVEFEKRLRVRVKSIMQDEAGPAPAALVQRIRAAMAAADLAAEIAADAPDDAPGHATAGAQDDTAPATAPVTPARPPAPVGSARAIPDARKMSGDAAAEPHTPSRRRSRPQASIFMIAATLTLVAGAVLIGIFGPSIDEVSDGPDLVSAAANWASSEHGRCAGDAAAERGKVAWSDIDQARRQLAAHLGVPEVSVPLALSAIGYEFRGAGPCMVPSGGLPSGHMIFRRPEKHTDGPAMLSVFVAPNVGQYDGGLRFGMIPGKWYTADGGPHCMRTIRRITDGDVVFLLVCCDERDLTVAERTIALHLRGVR